MATEKILNTRIQLKYDSFSEWSTKNPTLKAGEVAIAYLTTAGAVKPGETDTQHPVMFKVGPGAFNSLPWASALAADVHAWAKKTDAEFIAWAKTVLTAGDFGAYSKSEIDAKFEANSAADLVAAKAYADGLASNYDAAGTAQNLVNGLNVADTAVTGKYVSAVSEENGKIIVSREDLPTYTLASGSANGTVAFNGADVAVTGLGSAAYTDAKAYDAAGSAATAKSEAIAAAAQDATDKVNALKNNEVKANADAIAAIKDHASVDSFADVMTEMAKYQTAGDYATKAQAQGYADAKDSAIAAAQASGDKAQGDLAAYIASNDAAVALKANQSALEAEIDRATKAEQANAAAIALLIDSTEGDDTKLNSIKELATWIEDHGEDAAKMAGAISDNADAITAEVKRASDEEARLAGLIADNASDIADNASEIAKNAAAIAALSGAEGKVAAAEKADVASSLDETGIAQVKAVKVDDAAHADSADKLGGVAAADYATKTYADQAEADALAAAKEHVAGVIANYYTKTEAEAQFMDSTETGNAIDAKITALNLGATYEPIGAETRAKAYADGLAGNYATAAQGAKADSALQNVEVGTGLKVSAKAENKQTIEIDTDVVFVFNCGNASTLVD